jgi:hypothetical protein
MYSFVTIINCATFSSLFYVFVYVCWQGADGGSDKELEDSSDPYKMLDINLDA